MYMPVLTSWTALLYFTYPDKYLALKVDNKAVIYILCLDIPEGLCKEYELGKYTVVVM